MTEPVGQRVPDAIALEELLQDPTKKIAEAEGILARLFRQLLYDMDVTKFAWNSMMERYLEDERAGINYGAKGAKSTERNNLRRPLTKPVMTWRTFIMGLTLLRMVKGEFHVFIEIDGDMLDIYVELKPFNAVNNLLMTLYKGLLVATRTSPTKWKKLLTIYVNDPRNKVSPIKKKRDSFRTNMFKELYRTKCLSWLNFTRGVQILNPPRTVYLVKIWTDARKEPYTASVSKRRKGVSIN